MTTPHEPNSGPAIPGRTWRRDMAEDLAAASALTVDEIETTLDEMDAEAADWRAHRIRHALADIPSTIEVAVALTAVATVLGAVWALRRLADRYLSR